MTNLMTRTSPLLAAFLGLSLGMSIHAAIAQDGHGHEQELPPVQKWSFSGPFGTFDRAQLQRGFQIYKEVCSACHGLDLLSYRNLTQAGGPQFPEAQAKAIAAEFKVADKDDKGEPVMRPAELKDRFANPFPNKKLAEDTYGKVPPDLSVMAKARTSPRGFPLFVFDAVTGRNIETGPDYLYGLLVGYADAPAGSEPPQGSYFNKYFPGNNIAMPNMLAADGQVTYQDGTPATIENYARDVTAFLMWAAEPKLEERKRIGFQAIIFLVIFAGLLYFTKKKVWSDLPH